MPAHLDRSLLVAVHLGTPVSQSLCNVVLPLCLSVMASKCIMYIWWRCDLVKYSWFIPQLKNSWWRSQGLSLSIQLEEPKDMDAINMVSEIVSVCSQVGAKLWTKDPAVSGFPYIYLIFKPPFILMYVSYPLLEKGQKSPKWKSNNISYLSFMAIYSHSDTCASVPVFRTKIFLLQVNWCQV